MLDLPDGDEIDLRIGPVAKRSGLLRVTAFSGGLVSLGLLTVTIIGFNVN